MIRPAVLPALLFVVFAGVCAPRAEDNSFLRGFAGQWRGTGAVRTALDKPQETLVCRVDGEMEGAGGDHLQLSGRCGGERFTGTFSVSLTFNPASGRYTAVWRDSLGAKSPPITGLLSGDRLVFRVRHNDFESDGRAISTLVVDPGSAQFRVVGRTEPESGGGEFMSANLVFVRG